MKQTIHLDLCPPSINGFYRHNKFGTYITKKGREYKKYVEQSLQSFKDSGDLKSYGDKRIKISYEFNFKGKRKRDCDNYIKSMQDCLGGILFEDDEAVDEIYAKRTYHNEYNHTIITIEEITPPEGAE